MALEDYCVLNFTFEIFWDLYNFLRSVSFFEIWIIFWDLIHFLRSGFFWDLNNFLRSGLFFEICICFWDPKRTSFLHYFFDTNLLKTRQNEGNPHKQLLTFKVCPKIWPFLLKHLQPSIKKEILPKYIQFSEFISRSTQRVSKIMYIPNQSNFQRIFGMKVVSQQQEAGPHAHPACVNYWVSCTSYFGK